MQTKFILTILVIGFLGRMIPHAWNYTPILALAMFSGTHLNKQQTIVVPFLFMLLTDIFLGFYSSVAYTWLAVILCAYLGALLKRERSATHLVVASLLSSAIFFVVSNFGVWVASYPLTLTGFMTCYTLAIPFFRNTLLSTLVYSFVLIGGYDWMVRMFLKPIQISPNNL